MWRAQLLQKRSNGDGVGRAENGSDDEEPRHAGACAEADKPQRAAEEDRGDEDAGEREEKDAGNVAAETG